ncbi:hypothetical protein TREMEDRAFT_41800 [Tremella mesenterica DSM 1558]|uniref:uncharacterized protein n=1 Tax=Tremella mesenterica (strain ATCC 24925 / CBS 8224 / DSM 1558 / NBRC 9311 / NRRL Y-6157 / RJB 2259-6 / UBC 559-6) TaxID=578456 RepID=UPI0003F494FA|nr:uncharacterized protein TREMEDRAFT_41800 [Tremella mesenterica DSM 1558]EIW72511.1 hypothetical protein TREMEDRAFT_41800 [Tremella mesenterica DSM 1558]
MDYVLSLDLLLDSPALPSNRWRGVTRLRQTTDGQDFCHRMKMKCIGKENPPCNRCRQSGHVCTFDGPRKSKSSKVEDRLRIVEAQMGALQTTMEELLRLQQGGSRPMFTPQTMNSGQHATDSESHLTSSFLSNSRSPATDQMCDALDTETDRTDSFQHTPPVATELKGHAMRIAMDMGLYRCLPYLAQNGMGAGKTPDQIREDYPLVVGARMWLAVSRMKLTSRMAFNMGRPALFAGEETIRHSRQFLEHPLSISTDARLVSSSELLTLRLPLHQPYSILPASASMPGLDEKLIESRRKVDEWYTYWEQYFVERGVPATDLLRENIVTGRCGTFMYVNSRILHGVRNKQDIAHLSDQRKEALIIAVRAAEKLVATALRGGQYKENFRYANLYTHMGAAFASRFLIRMASLLPEAVDVRQVSRDVEQIAQLLTQVPGFQFATLLRDVLQRARRNRILPPPSKAPSPIKQIMPLPPIDWDPTLPTMTSTSTPAHNNLPPPSFNFNDLDTITTNFDFTYADQLFTNSGRTSGPPQTLTFPPETPGTNNIDSQGYLLDMWFPFPPLGESSPPGASIGLAGPVTGEGEGQPPVLATPAALPLGPGPVQNGQSGAQSQTWW